MMVRKKTGWMVAGIGDQLVMMSVEKGVTLGLNPVGARIWELIDISPAVPAICELLVAEFEIAPERCRAEVDAFLETLARRGAIDVDLASPA